LSLSACAHLDRQHVQHASVQARLLVKSIHRVEDPLLGRPLAVDEEQLAELVERELFRSIAES